MERLEAMEGVFSERKNIYTVSNGIATNCHPLSPSVRKSFDIVPFEFASEEGVKE